MQERGSEKEGTKGVLLTCSEDNKSIKHERGARCSCNCTSTLVWYMCSLVIVKACERQHWLEVCSKGMWHAGKLEHKNLHCSHA